MAQDTESQPILQEQMDFVDHTDGGSGTSSSTLEHGAAEKELAWKHMFYQTLETQTHWGGSAPYTPACVFSWRSRVQRYIFIVVFNYSCTAKCFLTSSFQFSAPFTVASISAF